MMKLPFAAKASTDSKRLIATRAMRGFGDGAVSVLLPSYLTLMGLSPTRIGVVLFGTLFGSALLTLWAGLNAHRIGRRRLLLGAAALMLATGIGFTYARSFRALFIVAFVGTMNPSAGDVSLFLPLEQAALAETVATSGLTGIFASYNVAGAFGGAVGALASGLPSVLSARLGWDTAATQRLGFVIYAALAIIAACLYWTLTPAVEAEPQTVRTGPLTKSRSIVIHLAMLFSLDSFSGGLVVQSLLALWLFRRFNLSVQGAGTLFFVIGIAGALSQFAAVPLAARIGRIKTMVYTHIPSSCFLILAAMMPTAPLAITFLIMRSLSSSMDVPARQSFVMAVVPPEERSAAASVTNVPRSLASAMSPVPAGLMMNASLFGWPLICAGSLKILYDLLLLIQFRAVKPEDEAHL